MFDADGSLLNGIDDQFTECLVSVVQHAQNAMLCYDPHPKLKGKTIAVFGAAFH